MGECVVIPSGVRLKAQLSRLLSVVSSKNRFDWIIEGLAVGTDNVPKKILKQNGVDCIVSVGAKLAADYEAERLFLNVEDGEPPSENEALKAVEWIAQRVGRGKRVFVHCHAGMGRSTTLVACYLIARGLTFEEALKTLKERHPQTSPTKAQLEFLKNFEAKYRGVLKS